MPDENENQEEVQKPKKPETVATDEKPFEVRWQEMKAEGEVVLHQIATDTLSEANHLFSLLSARVASGVATVAPQLFVKTSSGLTTLS